jgi:hypothetical protein
MKRRGQLTRTFNLLVVQAVSIIHQVNIHMQQCKFRYTVRHAFEICTVIPVRVSYVHLSQILTFVVVNDDFVFQFLCIHPLHFSLRQTLSHRQDCASKQHGYKSCYICLAVDLHHTKSNYQLELHQYHGRQPGLLSSPDERLYSSSRSRRHNVNNRFHTGQCQGFYPSRYNGQGAFEYASFSISHVEGRQW